MKKSKIKNQKLHTLSTKFESLNFKQILNSNFLPNAVTQGSYSSGSRSNTQEVTTFGTNSKQKFETLGFRIWNLSSFAKATEDYLPKPWRRQMFRISDFGFRIFRFAIVILTPLEIMFRRWKFTFLTGLIFAFCILNFMGCATYKFQHGIKPYDKGYVVSRDGYTILEYTVGKNNSVPDLELARERFKKRKNIVEHNYKKMGYIENRFKMAFWDPCILFIKAIGGVLRLPFVAIADYKYEHNPKYREKMIKKEQEQDAKEEVRIQKLKDELNIYIQKELAQDKPE